MDRLTICGARVLTLAGGAVPRRRAALRDPGVIERGWVAVEDGRIRGVGGGAPPRGRRGATIDAGGCVLMPAFIDCHTHACWAGQRFDEHDMRLAGASYLEILRAGGGIMSTVRAVRAATPQELTGGLLCRLERMAALGTATVEVKSGYGLTTGDELKMLRAIGSAAARTPLRIVPTFLGAHAVDPDDPDLVERTIGQTLPQVVAEFPGIACDAYCESGAWTLADTRRLFEAAAALGCPLRVHADQFTRLGMTRLAVEMGARSVDHLEASAPLDLEHLAHSTTIGVALPACGYWLDGRYAPARALVDAGGALALATNCNPGSAPTPSMPFVVALAVRHLGLRPEEAIGAATINAACVLGLEHETGSIEPGKRADLQLLDGPDERELAYELAAPGPRWLMIGGRIVHRRGPMAPE
jgi:imidazolonepropionase